MQAKKIEAEYREQARLKQQLTRLLIKRIFKLKKQGCPTGRIIKLMSRDPRLLGLLHNAQKKYLDRRQLSVFLYAKQLEDRIRDF